MIVCAVGLVVKLAGVVVEVGRCVFSKVGWSVVSLPGMLKVGVADGTRFSGDGQVVGSGTESKVGN